ncbi:MAG: GspH/FimT family pseudopilin [Methylomicrobium sp.]|jgi:type IV fimbrial biogenesis protein FimT
MKKQKMAGFTLIEALVVIAIIGILAALGVPSFQDMLERNRLKQVVESLKSDLQFARSEAIKHSEDVIVSRKTGNAGSWCYGLARKNPSTKTSCDCEETDSDEDDYCDIKIVSGANFGSTNMNSASGNSSFDFRRGTIGNNGVTFSTNKYGTRVVFSSVGRVRICSPSTTDNPMPTGKIGLPDKESCSE